ncbi:hypothetical protein GF337_02525 [candidate division KSB1 bacterium]|nr:hypothetical protein [candidate division KSB1 bacterium]
MFTVIKKMWFNIQCRGLFNLFFITIIRLLQKFIPFELLIFFEKSLSCPVKELNPKEQISFSKGDWDDICELDPREYHLSGLELYEMNNNRDCYIGRMDKIVFYVWVSYKNIYDDKIFDIALSENQAYIYRAFTHPDYRGLRIYPAGLSFVCSQLQRKNISKCFIATSIENRSSINGIHRAGFSKIGYAVYFKVLKYKKIILPRMLQNPVAT